MLKETFSLRLFLIWSIYIGVTIFLLWLSWELGFLAKIFTGDPTRITYLIGLFFVGGTIHCGIRAYLLSLNINSINDICCNKIRYSEAESLPARFLLTVIETLQQDKKNNQEPDKQLLTDIFSSEAHNQHEIGWFITSLLVKLGLLGTVIGFVLMLQPLSTLESFDIADIQGILASMTGGMSVALNTTLLGLISSMFLSFQYLLIDRGADELVVRTVHYMETSLVAESGITDK